MDSTYLKVAMLHKLRFIARNSYLATEVGTFGADVATISGNKLVEYETKISMSDFRADFKKPKHSLYLGQGKVSGGRYGIWVPHQFYFVVPGDIAEKVAAHLINYPKYGLIVIKDKTARTWEIRESPVVIRRAKLLHSNAIQPQVYQDFLLRMGSEIASLSTLKLRSDYVQEKEGREEAEQSTAPGSDPEEFDSGQLQSENYDGGSEVGT